jgi:LmbE family N-acetylglucosaminyl deacetylase
MTIAVDLQALSPCDSLYVSPHHDDVLLSCGARLLADASRGLRILVVTVFGEGARPWPEVGALAAAGIRQLSLGLPDARRRSDYYSSFQALVEGRRADDDGWVKQLAEALGDIGHRSKASQVYVPLGVGSHIDHRLSHEASLRALQSGDGRNVFLYEERPEAFVRGAVRVRLGQVGARLPPAAIHAADRARLAPFLWRFHLAPSMRGDLKGWPERLRSTGLAARQWRQGRAWHPQKGFGPRLQPVVHPTEPALFEGVRQLQAALASSSGAATRVARISSAYARRLGGGEHAERFWLLLPPREEGGITTVAESDEVLPARAG